MIPIDEDHATSLLSKFLEPSRTEPKSNILKLHRTTSQMNVEAFHRPPPRRHPGLKILGYRTRSPLKGLNVRRQT